MSKIVLWSYDNIIQLRKVKMVKMLLSEIIFLKTRFERTRNKQEISYLKNGLDKLEFLLNKLENNNSNISEKDFDRIIMLIYHIFREITHNLE